MKILKSKEKFVIATKLLTDSSGVKMGKTENNMVTLDQSADDIYGKIMSWDDSLIVPGFELCTNINMEEFEKIKREFESGQSNPKEYKMNLAKEIVSLVYDKQSAEKAQENFIKTFKKGEAPEDIRIILTQKGMSLRDLLVKEQIVSSNTEWRRLIEENAVSIVGTDEIIKDSYIKTEKDIILRIGKKRFVKIMVK